MDVPGVLELIDQALDAIDMFHKVYKNALDHEDSAFREFWEMSLEVEQTEVLPRLELVRQVALHVGAPELPVAAPPDKTAYNLCPFEGNRNALVVLRTRLAEQERMAA